jgi:hypothetical protein
VVYYANDKRFSVSVTRYYACEGYADLSKVLIIGESIPTKEKKK